MQILMHPAAVKGQNPLPHHFGVLVVHKAARLADVPPHRVPLRHHQPHAAPALQVKPCRVSIWTAMIANVHVLLVQQVLRAADLPAELGRLLGLGRQLHCLWGGITHCLGRCDACCGAGAAAARAWPRGCREGAASQVHSQARGACQVARAPREGGPGAAAEPLQGAEATFVSSKSDQLSVSVLHCPLQVAGSSQSSPRSLAQVCWRCAGAGTSHRRTAAPSCARESPAKKFLICCSSAAPERLLQQSHSMPLSMSWPPKPLQDVGKCL